MKTKGMYHSLEAELHDHFWEAEGESAELPLIKQFLADYPGTALELGCGSGRLLLPLLENGFLVEGLDNSQEMLDLCEKKSGDSSPVLHHASLEDFQTSVTYGSILIPAFTIQFIAYDTIVDALKNMKQHLHPDGALYITTFIPWAEIAGELEESTWYSDHAIKKKTESGTNTAKCKTRFEIQRFSQKLTREHRYKITCPKGKVLESSASTHELTWYWQREFKKLLAEAGFTVQRMIGDFAPDEDCDENSHIITTIATLSEEADE